MISRRLKEFICFSSQSAIISHYFSVNLSSIPRAMVQDALLAVTLIYRHGERTPIQFYPNDPYKDSPIWTEVPGDLTNVGKLQMHELGRWLRNRYDGFLSRTYKRSEIFVQASNKDRCIRSAAATLAGLYPPEGKDVWHPNLSWQPLPIHTVPERYDNILYFLEVCPKYLKLISKMMKIIDEDHKGLFEYLSKNTGVKISTALEAIFIWDVLDVEEKKGLQLPEWATTVQHGKLKFIRDEYFRKHTSTSEITRLVTGRFFHELLHQYTNTENREDFSKMKMYSGHDLNIDVILAALKIPHSLDIPLATTLIFELWKTSEGNQYIRIMLKTDTVEILEIPGCGSKCKFEDFVKIVRSLSLSEEQWHQECSSRNGMDISKDKGPRF